jgi:molybdopterin-biosynthesis enzyme MoeA-like protein
VTCGNIYILPGIPQLFEQKFVSLRDRFTSAPYVLRVVYTRAGEGAIAEHLDATLAAFPALLLGSYPKLGDSDYAVKLTLESKDAAYVEGALAHLLGLLPPETIVRTE